MKSCRTVRTAVSVYSWAVGNIKGLLVMTLRTALCALSRGIKVVFGAPPQAVTQYINKDWHSEK